MIQVMVIGGLLLLLPGLHTQTTHPRLLSPVQYVWVFGYVGDGFAPQTQLGLSPSQVLSAVSQISSAVGGRNNLVLVSAVDETQGALVKSGMYATVKGYVFSLHEYAKQVFGRLDLDQFNATSSPTIYSAVGEYVNTLGLDGVFLDHAADYYASVGGVRFNAMMQTLATEYPSAQFILNQADAQTVIVPLGGYTWAAKSFVSPSVNANSYDQVSLAFISQLSADWAGRIILHLDSYASVPSEPMGIFADQSYSTEVNAVSYLDTTGSANDFYLLFPVLGAWTCTCSGYQGTLYNSLGTGSFARDTLPSFIQTMQDQTETRITGAAGTTALS